MTKIDPRIRITLYLVLSAVGVGLVTWGIVTQDLVDGILPVVAGILMVSGGGVATKNVPHARDTPPDLREIVGMAREGIPAILAEVNRLRVDVERRAVPQSVAEPVLEYVPEQAPWLPAPEEYVGEHRAEG